MAKKHPAYTPSSDHIVDLNSITLNDLEQDMIVDLNSISMAEGKKSPGSRLRAIRANAPDLQLIARCSLPILGIIYFATNPSPPLLLPLPIIIVLCVIFLLSHLYLYRQFKRHGFSSQAMISANQLDIAVAHFAWFFDPADPAPLLLFVLIAAVGNGIQHGFNVFRAILQSTLISAPLVFALRVMLIGFNPTSLVFLLLTGFLLVYAYYLIKRIDAIQTDTEHLNTSLELDNFKLKQLGMALQNSEARYRNIFDTNSVAMVLLENNMRISIVNSKFEKLTRFSKSELYNQKRLSDLIYRDDLERIRRFHARRKKMGGTTPTEYECKLVDKANNIKHVIIRFNITHWHERIMATVEDITSRKQAKAALQRSNIKLRQTAALLTQSEKGYRNLFENTGTATILVGKNMRILKINSKFSELTGYSKKEFTVKRRLSEFIEQKNLYRIKRFQAKQKIKGLPLPTEYECLIVDKKKNLKHVVMKIYTPPEQETSIVSFFDITKRKQAEAELQRAHEKLRLVAIMDELTQVANRRRFNEKLSSEWSRLKREGLPLALIMCDVDFFKAYNDNYGHQSGDQCLRSIADMIKKTVKRSIDVVARYGGEEFAIIMPNTDLHGALSVAEATRVAVEQLRIPHKMSPISPGITLSLGVTSMIPTQNMTPETLIKDADNALYEAKRLGRNRTVAGKCNQDNKSNLRTLWNKNTEKVYPSL